jgi:hypothetical protein
MYAYFKIAELTVMLSNKTPTENVFWYLKNVGDLSPLVIINKC